MILWTLPPRFRFRGQFLAWPGSTPQGIALVALRRAWPDSALSGIVLVALHGAWPGSTPTGIALVAQRLGTGCVSLVLAWSPLLFRRLRVLCPICSVHSWIILCRITRHLRLVLRMLQIHREAPFLRHLELLLLTLVLRPPSPLLVGKGCVRVWTPIPSPRPSRSRGLWVHWPRAYALSGLFVRAIPRRLPPLARRVFGARSGLSHRSLRWCLPSVYRLPRLFIQRLPRVLVFAAGRLAVFLRPHPPPVFRVRTSPRLGTIRRPWRMVTPRSFRFLPLSQIFTRMIPQMNFMRMIFCPLISEIPPPPPHPCFVRLCVRLLKSKATTHQKKLSSLLFAPSCSIF